MGGTVYALEAWRRWQQPHKYAPACRELGVDKENSLSVQVFILFCFFLWPARRYMTFFQVSPHFQAAHASPPAIYCVRLR
jgi:hypothetical protein